MDDHANDLSSLDNGSPPGPAWAQRFLVVRRPAQDMYMTDPTKDEHLK